MQALGAILRALEAETRRSACLARELQAALGEAAAGSGLDAGLVVRLQGMDALSQRLDAVAAFLRALGPTAPACWTLDAERAAALVPLAGLARRLAGAPEPLEPDPLEPEPGGGEPGVLELFGDG